jgi:hypothetical protein
MADMIEHSKFISVHELKQQWEDELVAENEEKIKMGLIKKCMNCHEPIATCGCIGHTLNSTYWGY